MAVDVVAGACHVFQTDINPATQMAHPLAQLEPDAGNVA
jgi:hypothetical protein